MPSDRRERSMSAGSNRSGLSRASSSMGFDGGEAGRRMAMEDEYIRSELHDSTSFCNSFWGVNDAGYPVVQSRMKGAGRVLEDLRAMYKERADIEAEYSKRLGKLAKQGFGKDETGSMRAAIDVVRMEIDQTSKTHADLSALIKKDLEGQLTEFTAKIQNQRKNSLAQIEKLFKQKQTQESYVAKSKDKYEQDCIKINGYTAQSSLVQGRDLDKVTTKLDKAQSTVSSNDKDYQNFVRALKDTTFRWNSEWKTYLDQCQDLEEERLEYLKSNLWNYANAISAVCVADDESCERVRVSLENCEAPKDIMDFIQRAGTGSAIADPPEYINYSKGQPPPPRPTFKTARFQRSTTRQTPYLPTGPPPSMPILAPSQSSNSNGAPPPVNKGPGAGPPPDIQVQTRTASLAQPPSQMTYRGALADGDNSSAARQAGPGAVPLPGMAQPNTQATVPDPVQDEGSDAAAAAAIAAQGSTARNDKRMSTKNFLARTPSMSKSGRGPVGNQVVPSETNSTVSTSHTTIDHQDDPIAKALANLRMRPGGRSPGPQSPAQGAPVNGAGQRNSQYGSIGPHRAVSPASFGRDRAPSPSAAFMQEPTERSASPLPVEEVLGQYHQHFPGERRAVSRQNSTASRNSRMSVQQAPPPDRARSPGPPGEGGFAGVGARGRSPSPQPFHRPQQPSMSQQQQPQRPTSQYVVSQQQHQSGRQALGAAQARPPSRSSKLQSPVRSTTPLGIALDASGSVTHDQMADDFIKRSGSVGPGMASSASQPAVQRVQQSQYGGPHGGMASPVHGPGQGYAPPPVQQQQSYSSMGNQYAQQQQQHQGQPAQYSHQQQQQQQPYPQSQTPNPIIQQLPMHQDSMSSLRQDGFGGFTSPYNRTPAAAAAPIAQAPTPSPANQAYAQQQQQSMVPPQQSMQQHGQGVGSYQAPVQETPASSYMHQYQQSHLAQQQPPPSGSGTPGPGSMHQQASYGQSQQAPRWGNQQQQQPAASNSYANQGQYQMQPQHHQPQSQPQIPVSQQAAPPSHIAQSAAPPTRQFNDAGKPILFYVTALYDYQATTDEEFSFTTNDIIAVWETNPDGWWMGELLDDARRRPGANTFPSNFVSLLS